MNVTPGGTDRGAEPILERHGEVVANVLDEAGTWNAGRRKVGMESNGRIDTEAALRAHRRCAEANISEWLLELCYHRCEVFWERVQPYGCLVSRWLANQMAVGGSLPSQDSSVNKTTSIFRHEIWSFLPSDTTHRCSKSNLFYLKT